MFKTIDTTYAFYPKVFLIKSPFLLREVPREKSRQYAHLTERTEWGEIRFLCQVCGEFEERLMLLLLAFREADEKVTCPFGAVLQELFDGDVDALGEPDIRQTIQGLERLHSIRYHHLQTEGGEKHAVYSAIINTIALFTHPKKGDILAVEWCGPFVDAELNSENGLIVNVEHRLKLRDPETIALWRAIQGLPPGPTDSKKILGDGIGIVFEQPEGLARIETAVKNLVEVGALAAGSVVTKDNIILNVPMDPEKEKWSKKVLAKDDPEGKLKKVLERTVTVNPADPLESLETLAQLLADETKVPIESVRQALVDQLAPKGIFDKVEPPSEAVN